MAMVDQAAVGQQAGQPGTRPRDEVDLEAALQDLGVDLAEHQAEGRAVVVELAVLAAVDAGDVVLVDVGPDLEAVEDVGRVERAPDPLVSPISAARPSAAPRPGRAP